MGGALVFNNLITAPWGPSQGHAEVKLTSQTTLMIPQYCHDP